MLPRAAVALHTRQAKRGGAGNAQSQRDRCRGRTYASSPKANVDIDQDTQLDSRGQACRIQCFHLALVIYNGRKERVDSCQRRDPLGAIAPDGWRSQ